MVAKKMPAKKLPPAPKKEVQASKVPAKKAAAPAKRTDAAGRQGMGETSSSNMRFKAGSSTSSANRTAYDASKKSPGSNVVKQSEYIKSIAGAARYADSKKTVPKKKK